jgi:predicted transcriptional regulator
MQPALDGDAIMAFRERADLPAKDLAVALGICRASLYRWEAEGVFHAHNGVAAEVMAWLLGLEGEKLRRVVRDLKSKLALDPRRARSWLYSLLT